MQALIHFFIELCLLRRGPEDLPASAPLVKALAAVYVAVGILVGLVAEQNAVPALAQGLVDLGLLLGLLYFGLRWARRPARFLQAGAALLGTGALMSLLVVIPLGMATGGEQSQMTGVAALVFLGILAWSIVVTGYILSHTLDLTLVQGALIAVAYNLLAYVLLGALFTGA